MTWIGSNFWDVSKHRQFEYVLKLDKNGDWLRQVCDQGQEERCCHIDWSQCWLSREHRWWPLFSLSDSGSPDCAAEPGSPCDAVHGCPAGSHGGRHVRLQLPPTHTALQAIESPLQMKRWRTHTHTHLLLKGNVWHFGKLFCFLSCCQKSFTT